MVEIVVLTDVSYRLTCAGSKEFAGEFPAPRTRSHFGRQGAAQKHLEITIKEGETILRKGRITLRSKMPEWVRQEFWGMIPAHYLVRKMMAQAALDKRRDPDELSYEGSIEIIKSTLAGPVLSFSP